MLGFNHDGNKLATVSTDNEHTVTIWNWRTGEKELNAAACQGIPPVVYGILWNPFKGQSGAHPCDFVTYGIKHINFWTLGGEAGLEAGAGSFDVCAQQDVLCACFLQTNHCLFGGPNGDISVFEDGMVTNPRPLSIVDYVHPPGASVHGPDFPGLAFDDGLLLWTGHLGAQGARAGTGGRGRPKPPAAGGRLHDDRPGRGRSGAFGRWGREDHPVGGQDRADLRTREAQRTL